MFDENLSWKRKNHKLRKWNCLARTYERIRKLRLAGAKVARTNECHDLAIMAKTVGSNFFLMNRRLSANLNYAFAALSAEGGAASACPYRFLDFTFGDR